MPSPEELARKNIDALLKQCGWIIQKRSEINLSAGHGIAITENQSLIRRLPDQQFVTPDDGRKFTELYNVQHLNGAVGDSATWTLDPKGSRAGARVINGASGLRATWTAQPRRVAESESGDERIKSSQLDNVSRVCHARNASRKRCGQGISTIQCLYSMLRSLFFWDRNADAARRDQRGERGNAPFACSKRRNVTNLSSI